MHEEHWELVARSNLDPDARIEQILRELQPVAVMLGRGIRDVADARAKLQYVLGCTPVDKVLSYAAVNIDKSIQQIEKIID